MTQQNKSNMGGVIVIVLVILLVGLGAVWFLSGGLDAIDSTKDKSNTEGMKSDISTQLEQIVNDSKASMKSITKKAQNALKSALDSLKDALNVKEGSENSNKSDGGFDIKEIFEKIKNFFLKLIGQDTNSSNNATINFAKNKVDSASKDYSNAKSNDNVFKDSMAKLTEDPEEVLPYLLAVVFVVLIVILLMKKPAEKPEIEKEPDAKVQIVVQQEPAPQSQQIPKRAGYDSSYRAQMYEGVSESALTTLCDTYDIQMDYIMSVYGDVDVALARLNTYITTCDGNTEAILKRIENDKEV